MIIRTIAKQHFCGDGISLDDTRRPLRIANALKGESVTAIDVSVKRRHQACLVDVLSPAPHRCAPACPHYKRCPACQFQCLDIQAQRELKRNSWISLIRKFVALPENFDIGFLPAVRDLGYRHRTDAVVYSTAGGPIIGIAPRLDCAALEAAEYAAQHNIPDFSLRELEPADIYTVVPFTPVPLNACALHAPELNALIQKTQDLLHNQSIPNELHIGFEAFEQNARLIIYAQPEFEKPTRNLAEYLVQNLNTPVIFQVLPPKGSHVYPKPESLTDSPWYCYGLDNDQNPLYALKGAWTPVNPQNAALIRKTLVQMTEGMHFENCLELGCGCGTHTSVFAPKSTNYVGIDASWPAIQSAQHNAELHHWSNAAFYTDTAEHYLEKRYYGGRRADAILMHSNRMPYSEKTAAHCKRFGARQIFIVAPTAYAMAMECRHFVQLGYSPRQLTLCDTLPMTYHMMAVAHLALD